MMNPAKRAIPVGPRAGLLSRHAQGLEQVPHGEGSGRKDVSHLGNDVEDGQLRGCVSRGQRDCLQLAIDYEAGSLRRVNRRARHGAPPADLWVVGADDRLAQQVGDRVGELACGRLGTGSAGCGLHLLRTRAGRGRKWRSAGQGFSVAEHTTSPSDSD